MATDENALVTWSYIQTMLDLDDEDQQKIESLIDAASASANLYTRRKLAARDHTVVLDGTGKKDLLLPDYPVNSITSVHIDSERAFGSDTEITDYLTYENEGRIWYDGGFPDIPQSVKVVWNGGYITSGETENVPEDIKLAIVEIVKWYFERLKGSAVGVTAIQNPNGITTRFESDMPISAKRRLDPYVQVIL